MSNNKQKLLRNIRMLRADIQRAAVDLGSEGLTREYLSRLTGWISASMWYGVINDQEYDVLCAYSTRLMQRFLWRTKG